MQNKPELHSKLACVCNLSAFPSNTLAVNTRTIIRQPIVSKRIFLFLPLIGLPPSNPDSRQDSGVPLMLFLDDTPLPIANCGVFNEPGKGQDVPDKVLAEDPEVEKYFPVIAEGSSMEDYGIRQEDVAWVKEKKYIDLSAYAVGDRVLIISRSPR